MKTDIFQIILGTILCCAPLVTSCGPAEPEEVVGEWRLASDTPRVIEDSFLSEPLHLSEELSIVFESDGQFAVNYIPEVLVYGERTGTLSGKGKWSAGSYQSIPAVTLIFEEIDGKKTFSKWRLYVSRGLKDITLYCWLSDPGNKRVKFARAEADIGKSD